MNIKKTIKAIVFAAIPLAGAVAAFSSCSNIDESERLIYVEPAKAARNVLIEDFTGQRCVNCPKGADAIHEMQEVFGESVIAVAIHCGPFGGLSAKNSGLMNDTGKEYWNAWFSSSQGQPVAKINRGAASESYNDWSNLVRTEMEKSTDVKINAAIDYDNKGNVSIYLNTIANAGRKAKLQVWITEDNITAPQDMPDGTRNREYVHQHVFRAAVNDPWGEDITYGEQWLEKTYTYSIDETWNPENLNLVVFVYDDSGVLQVVQEKASCYTE